MEMLPKRKSLNEGFWDDFTNRDVMQDYHVDRSSFSPSVNIIRKQGSYKIELIAPGLCREDYDIRLEDDILRIEATVPDKQKASENYDRMEYLAGDFNRSFVMPPNAKTDQIAASCQDGILSVRVPFREEDKSENRRTIEIN